MNASPAIRSGPSLKHYLLLCAATALWIDFSHVHITLNADSLLFSIAGRHNWTPFFWEQDRIGMFVPLLTSWCPDQLTTLLLQTFISAFMGLAVPVLLVELVYPRPAARVGAVIANALMLALAPERIRSNLLFECCYPQAMFLGCTGLLFLGNRDRPRWWRYPAALACFTLAHWVYLGACIWLMPLAAWTAFVRPGVSIGAVREFAFRLVRYFPGWSSLVLLGGGVGLGIWFMDMASKANPKIAITSTESVKPESWGYCWLHFWEALQEWPGIEWWEWSLVGVAASGENGYVPLANEVAEQAKELAKANACVGIIVNRVNTARKLKELLGEEAVLLTGRMRPLDRDDLFETKLKSVLSEPESDNPPPKFVIGTQCLEVGADFDFHALITECASLDALRQRFGRLNRIAKRDTADAVVVIRGDQTDDTSDDPVYGASLANTWKFLHEHAKDGVFDFGVAAVRESLKDIDLEPYNAPSQPAPVLFPAHLDCWVQTHPIPALDPDPALFLHGPKSGEPDVSVVFRSDLGANSDAWCDVVELCPPSSSEALPVRIGVFKKWLAGEPLDDATSDVEGEPVPEKEREQEKELEPAAERVALLWRGPNEDGKPPKSLAVRDPQEVIPGAVYVVPCDAPDARDLGDFPDAAILDDGRIRDHAEQAFLRSRDKALLRVTLEASDEDEDFDEKLTAAIETRRRDVAEERVIDFLAAPKKRLVEPHPVVPKLWIVTGKKRLGKYDPEFPDDDVTSFSSKPIPLADHSRGVAATAKRFAIGCGLEADAFEQAGLGHDLGKLDPRFQKLLKGYAGGAALAKSGSFVKRDRSVHMYPAGARHELLSAAILGNRTADELVLHLVATHHGSARPFANPVIENCKFEKIDEASFGVTDASSEQRVSEWNPELLERFWRMVRRYGWWGLAHREAVFRLADHHWSEAEQEEAAPATCSFDWPSVVVARQLMAELPLTGVDGSNPLGFLTALGTLHLAARIWPESRLGWQRESTWRPVLILPDTISGEEFIDHIFEEGKVDRACLTFADDLKIPHQAFREIQLASVSGAQADREFADFIRAYTDPLVTVKSGPNAGKTKPTEFYFIAGQQRFLEQVRRIIPATRKEHLAATLFEEWKYLDPIEGTSLRWDPTDDLRHATRFVNPSTDRMRGKRGSMLGANRLAFEALPFFPCFPDGERLITTGFTRNQRSPYFLWPVWTGFLGCDAIRSALSGIRRCNSDSSRMKSAFDLPDVQWYQSEKVQNSDYSNFRPSTLVVTETPL